MNGRERGELLREQIFLNYEQKAENRRPNRLRPSELGHECSRYLWYRFRWADELDAPEGRMLRLFDTGHSQEDRLIADLRGLGAEVHSRNPDNPIEQIPVEILDGHSKGYLDGVANGIPFASEDWCVVECKTHSDKSFSQLRRDGVATAKPNHYAQMQLYMHEHALKEALYLSVNKNNDDLHCEFVDYSERYALNLIRKAQSIVFGAGIPAKINNSGTFYACKFCNASQICHAGKLPSRSCRTCKEALPMTAKMGGAGGAWYCGYHNKELTLDDQRRGCPEHRYNPNMINGEVKDDQGDFLVYTMKDGTEWRDLGPIGDKALTSV